MWSLLSLYIISILLLWFQAYLDYFAKCLNMEYKEYGITVQTLVPAFLAGQDPNTPALDCENMLVPSPQTYAHSAVRTIGWSENSSGCLSHTVQVCALQQTCLCQLLWKYVGCNLTDLSQGILDVEWFISKWNYEKHEPYC